MSFTVALSVNHIFHCETHKHSALDPNDFFLANMEILPTNKKTNTINWMKTVVPSSALMVAAPKTDYS